MGGKNRNLRSYIKENGIMRALYVDDIILNDSGMFTLSGKYEETLNEKIQENKDVLEVHVPPVVLGKIGLTIDSAATVDAHVAHA